MNNTINVERAKKKMTQEELAKEIGVSRQTINFIEKKRFVPSTILAIKLSEFFGVTVNELFTLEEND